MLELLPFRCHHRAQWRRSRSDRHVAFANREPLMIEEVVERARVTASARTCQFVSARGGIVYVWLEGPGLVRATTKPPDRDIAFVRHDGPGFELHQDMKILTPHAWTIVHRRFPPRVEAIWNNADWLGSGT
jgi:hypothetical protein